MKQNQSVLGLKGYCKCFAQSNVPLLHKLSITVVRNVSYGFKKSFCWHTKQRSFLCNCLMKNCNEVILYSESINLILTYTQTQNLKWPPLWSSFRRFLLFCGKGYKWDFLFYHLPLATLLIFLLNVMRNCNYAFFKEKNWMPLSFEYLPKSLHLKYCVLIFTYPE